MKPLVSCILATRNRPAFLRQAIRCFLRQTYEHSELIVVDDGEESVAELCSGLYRVNHIHLDNPTSLGRKLNVGVEHARGAIIQKIDDDDYYHPQFLERAVGALMVKDQNHAVTWDCFLILLLGEQHVHYSGHGWTAGGTLCFRRQLWEQGHFRDVPNQVDTLFIADNRPQMIKICAPELYILVRHGHNTWNHLSSGAAVDGYFEQLPVYHKPLGDLIEPLDRLFYNSLGRERT